MGRGRAKAKQTKVARELKYSSGGTDLEALRKELVGSPTSANGVVAGGDLDDLADADDLEDADDLDEADDLDDGPDEGLQRYRA